MKTRLIKALKITIFIIVVIIWTIGVIIAVPNSRENIYYPSRQHFVRLTYGKWNNSRVIGHAFGKIDDIKYTNSVEAFNTSYELGLRTFEIDMQLTSDNKIVLAHDLEQSYNGNIPSYEEFMNTKLYDKYTPMSFEQIVLLMQKYEDIYIITDTKYEDKERIDTEFNEMINIIKSLNAEDILDRLIIQIYNEDMYTYIRDIYPFDNIIFTLYKRWEGDFDEFKEICKWCKAHHIHNITLRKELYSRDLYHVATNNNINLSIHTENTDWKARKFLINGVTAIYTDTLTPDEVKY